MHWQVPKSKLNDLCQYQESLYAKYFQLCLERIESLKISTLEKCFGETVMTFLTFK